jgi:predicted flap endonuclease-1-like 5' DNA nuclease
MQKSLERQVWVRQTACCSWGQPLILEWVNHIDLFRIRGIGEEYADLLEEAGVDTVVELAQRKAETLFNKMMEVNAAKNLVNKLPARSQVEDWVAQAKKLPRAISY